jgi:hypothetical protein
MGALGRAGRWLAPFCLMVGPTRMQWRCLVAYHRHHGNVKAAAHSLGISEWSVGKHLRALCVRIGVADRSDCSLYYAEDLRRALGHPRTRRPPRHAPEQADLGLMQRTVA